MATKANFTKDEWSCVLASPVITGMAITAADPSGLWGLLKEGVTSAWALRSAKQDANANALVRAVAEEFAGGDDWSLVRERLHAMTAGAQGASVKQMAVSELRSLSAILDTKAPEDASAFKRWLRDIAQQAAEAGNDH